MMVLLATADSWPDAIDGAVIAGYLILIAAIPLAGYVLLVCDIRAYYRRLKRALVLVSHYTTRVPRWLTKDQWRERSVPPCVAAFGLDLPCSEADLLDAYRRLAKQLHPDCGGDRNEFLQMQRYFEEARSLLTATESDERAQ